MHGTFVPGTARLLWVKQGEPERKEGKAVTGNEKNIMTYNFFTLQINKTIRKLVESDVTKVVK